MSSAPFVLLPQDPLEKHPWRAPLVIHAVAGCGILTAEIALPYGEALLQEHMETWVREHAPRFLERHGQILRFRLLASRNAPEGTRHRLLLIAAPEGGEDDQLCDMRVPQEFRLLGQAEAEASARGGDFIWTTQDAGCWHWMLYREGQLAFWGVESLPGDHEDVYVKTRLEAVRSFALGDPQFERVESIEVVEALPAQNARLHLLAVCGWSWVHSLNLLPLRQVLSLECKRHQRQAFRNAGVALLLVFLVGLFLWRGEAKAEAVFTDLRQQAGPLVAMQQQERRLLDTLSQQVAALQKHGRIAQSALQAKQALRLVFQALPKEGALETMNLENTSADGFRYLLQIHVSSWDEADQFLASLRKQKDWRSVRLDSRRPSGKDQIQVRVEVIR